jgi:hypothetical protein
MSGMTQPSDDSRREFVKRAACLTPATLTLVATPGTGQPGFDPTLNCAAGTIGKRLRDCGVNVSDFPWSAKFDGVTDDTAAIQACIAWLKDHGGGQVYLPAGTAKITSPILTYEDVELIGQGAQNTILSKATNAVGHGTSRARNRTINDNYAVDSIISIWHEDNAIATRYAYRAKLKGIGLHGVGNAYGVFAPRLSACSFEELFISNVQVGFATCDAWMCTHKRVTCQGVSCGWRFLNDGSGQGTGTSNVFENCWVNFDNTARQPEYGFDIFGLSYSTLLSCGVDNCHRSDSAESYCYRFNFCTGIVMCGSGAEASRAGVLSFSASKVSVINLRTYAFSANAAWGTVGGVFNDGSTVTFINCSFAPYAPAAGVFNQVLQNGARQTEIDSTMPGGGNSYIGYGGNSKRTIIRDGQLSVVDAGGTANTVPLIGSATYDPRPLANGAGVTTTVAVAGAALGGHASASFSLDLQGMMLTAWVSAPNTVSVRFQNETGGTLDLASGTLRVRVIPA